MKITWEDRKNSGSIDNEPLTVKPVFSFEYAWFLVNDATAQYVKTHDVGTYNEDMPAEMKAEVEEFYKNYVFQGIKPSIDPAVERIKEDGTEVIDGKIFTKFVKVPFTEVELKALQRFDEEPLKITPRQCRLQLLALDLLDEVETAIASDKAMQIWFEYSLDFQRSHEMIISMGQFLGMDEEAMDNFFIEASKL